MPDKRKRFKIVSGQSISEEPPPAEVQSTTFEIPADQEVALFAVMLDEVTGNRVVKVVTQPVATQTPPTDNPTGDTEEEEG